MKVKKLFKRINGQVFVWAGEEPLEIKYSGFRFKIPPRTQTAKPDVPGTIYTFESARDTSGDLIPGTAWVTDVVRTLDDGRRSRTFDVAECCEFLQEQKSQLFEQGFAIVSDISDVRAAMKELIPMYEQSMDARAHAILASELDRQKKYEEKGRPVPEPDNPERVAWAMKHLAKRRKTMKPTYEADDIAAALEGRFDPGDIKPEAPQPAEEPVPNVSGGKELYIECLENDVRLTKREVEALLTGDTEQIGFIMEKLKVKKGEAAASPA